MSTFELRTLAEIEAEMSQAGFAKPARRSQEEAIVYRQPCCTTKHRSYAAIAKCLWPRHHWVAGEGGYATLSCTLGDQGRTGRNWGHPATLSVMLHETYEDALRAVTGINRSGCGGGCLTWRSPSGHRHRLIDITALRRAGPRKRRHHE